MHSIAHAHTARPDTGVSNTQLGVWLFLVSDLMLLASLFSGYVLLRAGAATIPEVPTSWPLLALQTALLLGVTLFVARAHGHAKAWPSEPQGNAANGKLHFSVAGGRLLWAASFVATVCAALQCIDLISTDVGPRDHVVIASWFVLAATHLLHVVGGVAATLWVTSGISTDGVQQSRSRLGALRLYWFFVAATWMVLVITFALS